MDSVTFQLPGISLSQMHLASLFIQYPGTLKLSAYKLRFYRLLIFYVDAGK